MRTVHVLLLRVIQEGILLKVTRQGIVHSCCDPVHIFRLLLHTYVHSLVHSSISALSRITILGGSLSIAVNDCRARYVHRFDACIVCV